MLVHRIQVPLQLRVRRTLRGVRPPLPGVLRALDHAIVLRPARRVVDQLDP